VSASPVSASPVSASPASAGTTSNSVPYVALPYVDRMDLAYAAADFALCRAGAMTCAELTAVGLPAAYVPLPIGNGEQRLNALPIVQRGGGLLVEDAELTADWIKSSLLPVLTNIDQVAGMSEAAAAMGRKDADRWLARAVMEIVAAEQASRAAAQAGGEAAASRPPQAPAPARQQEAEPGETQPGSLFTPNHTSTRQAAQGQGAQGQSAQGQAAKPQPPAGQPASGGGRHRQGR
jgi:hypothetical protein